LEDYVVWNFEILKQAIPMEAILSIGKDITNGMLYLHSKDIFHRDMNRGNFLMSKDFVVKVRMTPIFVGTFFLFPFPFPFPLPLPLSPEAILTLRR
jgi:hypothetical protein